MPTLGRRLSIEVQALDEWNHDALKVNVVQAVNEDLEAWDQKSAGVIT